MGRNPFGEECPTDHDSHDVDTLHLSTDKSRLCYSFYTTGCDGDNCPFAHVEVGGNCPFVHEDDDNCPFAHGGDGDNCVGYLDWNMNPFGEECPTNHDSHDVDTLYLSRLKYRVGSRFYTTGCDGDNCPFAHGGTELCHPRCYVKISSDIMKCTFKFPERKCLLPGTTFGKMKGAERIPVLRSSAAIVDSSLVNLMSNAKVSFEDHESDPEMTYIKLEGTMEEVDEASYMVMDYLTCIRPSPHACRGARDKWGL